MPLTVSTSPPPRPLQRMLSDGLLAAGLSALVLALRGQRDARSAAAPLNAVSHWLWPAEALARDEASLRFTASGVIVHSLASMFWAAMFGWLQRRRRRPTAAAALADAAAISAVAAVVDLKLVPDRLTPGFEHRLHKGSLALVYGAFATGLALGGLLALRREQ